MVTPTVITSQNEAPVESLASPYRASVEAEIQAILHSQDGGSLIYNIMRYHLGWLTPELTACESAGSKMIRSTLCLLVHEALAHDYAAALPAAAAVELIHNGSLMIDDVFDHDDVRRGRPTVWRLWGERDAILGGLAMQALMDYAVLRLAAHGVPPPKCDRALGVLTRSLLDMCEGQHLDMAFENMTVVGLHDYLTMIGGKTASLIGTACQLGALLASDDEGLIESYRRYGQELGTIYQMVDDVLGVWGAEERTGKSSNSDLINRKKSLPWVCAWQRADADDRRFLEQVYSQAQVSPEEAEHIRSIFEALEVKAACYELIQQHTETAQQVLEGTGVDHPCQDQLAALTFLASLRLN